MSFNTFPASLPFIAALHDQEVLDKEIDALSLKVASERVPVPAVAKGEAKQEKNPFVTALAAVQRLTLTENGATALSSTGNACVDLYASMTHGKANYVLLDEAFQHDALTTLKLLFHCRSIHDGKRNKFTFYSAFFWLLKNHPKTALKNLQFLVRGTITNRPVTDEDEMDASGWDLVDDTEAEARDKKKQKPLYYLSHGYWKDLLTLLSTYALNEMGADEYSAMKTTRQVRSRESRAARTKRKRANHKRNKELAALPKDVADMKRSEHDKDEAFKNATKATMARTARHAQRNTRHDRVIQLLETDPLYRLMHVTVARLFAEQLEADMATVQAYKESMPVVGQENYDLANKLSFAAKWAPSLAGAHDKTTFVATSIAEVVFLKDVSLAADESRRVGRLNDAREQYRRVVISPLRKVLDVTERKMSLDEWKKIDFGHVPAVCFQRNAKHFANHAKAEYDAFMQAVQQGKRNVAGATLGPHEFIGRAMEYTVHGSEQDEILVNAQWQSHIRALQDACGPDHALRNSIAICDVSGSMFSGAAGVSPLHAAIGLSLTLMALAAPPFDGMMITFHETPSIVKVDTSAPIVQQAREVSNAPWGGSTDLYAVFVDLLLPMAKRFNLKQEDMVKRLFVFTDMQFDSCVRWGNVRWSKFDTLWEAIVKEYNAAGYEPPEIVWWNLAMRSLPFAAQGSHDTPGMAMVAGFSQSMLKTFMDGQEIESEKEAAVPEKPKMTPEQLMNKDLAKPSFSALQVYD